MPKSQYLHLCRGLIAVMLHWGVNRTNISVIEITLTFRSRLMICEHRPFFYLQFEYSFELFDFCKPLNGH